MNVGSTKEQNPEKRISITPDTSKSLKGLDSLLSIVQMPKGVVTATVAINNAFNAGLLAAEIIALSDAKVLNKLKKFRTFFFIS